MDNILKRAIHNEIEEYMKKPKQTPEKVKPKAKRTESRLGSLLQKIRTSNRETSVKMKMKHIHLRYERYDSLKEKFVLVKHNEGGGQRFLEWPNLDRLSFGMIKEKARDLYFHYEGLNYYHESPTDCIITLCDPAGIELDLDENVWDYLKSTGQFVSKVHFILKSKDKSFLYLSECADEEKGTEDYDDELPAVLVNRNSNRCSKCHCTIIDSAECLICKQNDAYHASLFADQNDNVTTEEQSISDASQQESMAEENQPDIEEVRVMRLSHFQRVSGEITDQPSTSDEPESISPVGFSSVEHDIIIHRLNLKNDLMTEFISKQVKLRDLVTFRMIDTRGNFELGSGVGLSREVYSSYFEEIKDAFMVGECERVPVVRHDLFKQEWATVGLILVKAYLETYYFPSYLSKAFMYYCMFGEVSSDTLIDSFMKFVAKDEADVLLSALSDSDDAIFSNEEFLDILDQFKCRSMVTQTNVKRIIAELARQELVQKPFLMTSCWQDSFIVLREQQPFQTAESLKNFYNEISPTAKKVIALMKTNPNSDAERESYGYLKKFIKGLDNSLLKKFLKFVTGSDMVIVTEVTITFFKPTSNLNQHPIAHTCGPCLELPSTYNGFAEFREEFVNILKQNVWEMDIV